MFLILVFDLKKMNHLESKHKPKVRPGRVRAARPRAGVGGVGGGWSAGGAHPMAVSGSGSGRWAGGAGEAIGRTDGTRK